MVTPEEYSVAAARRLRMRNRVVLAVLLGLIAIIYVVTMIKEHH